VFLLEKLVFKTSKILTEITYRMTGYFSSHNRAYTNEIFERIEDYIKRKINKKLSITRAGK